MEGFAAVFALISLLGAAVTKAVDFVRNLSFFKNPDGSPKWVGSPIWNVLAFVFGLALCVGWQHSFVNDLFALVPALQNVEVNDTVGYVISGLIVGGSAGFFHELFDALSGIASRAHAEAGDESVAPPEVMAAPEPRA